MELEKHSHAQKMAILDAHRRVDLLPLPEKYVEHKDDERRPARLHGLALCTCGQELARNIERWISVYQIRNQL